MSTQSPLVPPLPEGTQLDRTLVKAFLENVPDMVFFKDRDSRYIAVSHSKARRHGRTPEQLVGCSDADFFTPEHARWARRDEQSILASGEPIIGKLERTQFIDGREGWTEVTKLPLRDASGAIIGTFGLSKDVTLEQEIALKLEQAHRELMETSRIAGMAEVATGVLHNVGNVLTSLNVGANVLANSLQQSKADTLDKLADLLEAHAGDLADFVVNDPKGSRIPEFLESLGQHAITERDQMLAEIKALQENVDHIKEIVSMQQAYATMIGVVEPLDAAPLLEDALRMNAGALLRHHVSVTREFHPTPLVMADKSKVLQILVNLIRNAKYAADEGGGSEKCVTLQLEASADGSMVHFIVRDNGVGIPSENLVRIFNHGFTTRKEGHGFGLHSAAAAAKEMKGTLTAESAGLGHGATFTLALPAAATFAEAPVDSGAP